MHKVDRSMQERQTLEALEVVAAPQEQAEGGKAAAPTSVSSTNNNIKNLGPADMFGLFP